MRSLAILSLPFLLLPLLAAGDKPSDKPEEQVGPKLTYSSADTAKTPAGDVTFHGPFTNETLTVSIEKLEPHEFLEISCDLLILHTWDGSVLPETQPRGSEPNGPDYLRLALKSGPTLLYTTFSNLPDDPGFLAEGKFQNYPSQVPGERLHSQTGAAATGTLGYFYPWIVTPQPFPLDATYKIKFTIPHKDKTAALEFTAMGLQNIIDESWGITHVQVRTLSDSAVQKPDAFEITNAFRDALDSKAKNQPEAFQTLIAGMDATAEWFAKNVQAKPIDAAHVAQLVKDLWANDQQLATRDSAEKELQAMGPIVEPYLRDARRTAPGEVRFRLDRIMKYVGVHPIEDENVRRIVLAARVLEIINTPRAVEVRRSLTEK